MCGIIGIVDARYSVTSRILTALEELEYRGYDSAGVGIVDGDEIKIRSVVGKVSDLREEVCRLPLEGNTGIGHTRWATHGAPSLKNTHPIRSGQTLVVHNGIIENYKELRCGLTGHHFYTDTDTEIIAALISHYVQENCVPLMEIVTMVASQLVGMFSFVVMIEQEPHSLIGVSKGLPLVTGNGDNCTYIASDVAAFPHDIEKVTYLSDGQLVKLRSNSYEITNLSGGVVTNFEQHVRRVESGTKGKFPYFMLKEIYDQPRCIESMLNSFQKEGNEIVQELAKIDWKEFSSIHIIACGSSFYAAMIGRYWFERFTKKRVIVEISSEFRSRDVVFCKNCLYVFISQSGETADTLAALYKCKDANMRSFAIVNAHNSPIARAADHVLFMNAGAERAVASTKTFAAQVLLMAIICREIGLQNILTQENALFYTSVSQMMEAIDNGYTMIERLVEQMGIPPYMLYVGRGTSYPLALEGALKMKELAYIPSEGIAAGELKHGPLALVDERVPVVVIAPYDAHFRKTISSIHEINARGGKIILISSIKGIEEVGSLCAASILVDIGDGDKEVCAEPVSSNSLSPAKRASLKDANNPQSVIREALTSILYTIPLQLLAYSMSVRRGYNPDRPRNLAKSVTVE